MAHTWEEVTKVKLSSIYEEEGKYKFIYSKEGLKHTSEWVNYNDKVITTDSFDSEEEFKDSSLAIIQQEYIEIITYWNDREQLIQFPSNINGFQLGELPDTKEEIPEKPKAELYSIFKKGIPTIVSKEEYEEYQKGGKWNNERFLNSRLNK